MYRVWNTPEANSDDTTLLDLASDVLGTGKTSRLYRRLVYQDQIATDAMAYCAPREIGSQFALVATARKEVDLVRVEKAVDEELQKFLSSGPTQEELDRVRTSSLASRLRGLERIGGFGGKSDLLARSQVFAGNPEAYKHDMQVLQRATTEDIRNAAKRWLTDGDFVLEVQPFPNLKATGEDVDRSKVPTAGTPPALKLPRMERATLSNGVKIILAERHELPLLSLTLALDAGFASDAASIPGTASLAMNMLDEGTKTRNALQIGEELESLGAQLRSGSNIDMSFVTLSALRSNLNRSLEVFSDVILNPAFPEADFRREQKLMIAGIQREKMQPIAMGIRVLPGLLYGPKHPYGNPMTGTGTEKSVASITRSTLVAFHQAWFKPNNATLIVVGDTTLKEITPLLEKYFQGWKQGSVPKKAISNVPIQPKSVVYLIDKPGAIQSIVFAGHLAPPKADPDDIAMETLNTILGGAFISRVNMNLREDKHWTYGAGTMIRDARGQRTFFGYAPVQSDKTRESMMEFNKEFRGIVSTRQASPEELAMAQDNQTLRLPGSRETTSSVAASIVDLVQFGLPDDYYETYSGKVRGLTTRDMATAAEKLVRPDNMVWVVVGDRSKIEAGIRELNYGELKFIDADGNPVQ